MGRRGTAVPERPSGYGQARRVADFLLAWHNAPENGGWDPTDLWNVDDAIAPTSSHLDGILSWTEQRVSNGAVEGMNNKIKSISHRSFGFLSANNFIAAIYHC